MRGLIATGHVPHRDHVVVVETEVQADSQKTNKKELLCWYYFTYGNKSLLVCAIFPIR